MSERRRWVKRERATVAKRRRTELLEDLLEIAAMLPWWVGLILAVLTYWPLHHYASAEVPASVAPGQLGQLVTGQFIKTLASVGQYLIPGALAVGAAASFLGRRKRAALVTDLGGDPSGGTLRSMSWQDFELLVGELFRRRGYTVLETGGGGADGGVDLKLRKDKELFLVQCKQWRAYKVSVSVVRELLGAMVAEGAAGGFVVTSGTFTAEARDFAKGRNVELIDGAGLSAMIGKVRRSPVTAQPSAGTAESSEPLCPVCGRPMVRRVARRGTKAGQAFWGCSSYPQCRGVRAIE